MFIFFRFWFGLQFPSLLENICSNMLLYLYHLCCYLNSPFFCFLYFFIIFFFFLGGGAGEYGKAVGYTIFSLFIPWCCFNVPFFIVKGEHIFFFCLILTL